MSDVRIALISEVFVGADRDTALRSTLARARDGGASIAILPELPLDPWVPATRAARDQDAEPEGGARHRALASAAADVGIGLVGGAIVRDRDGRRHNTALAFGPDGAIVGRFRKIHVPEEPGFWETFHYQGGDDPATCLEVGGLPFGVQICSDINRPQGTLALAATGATAIVNPRATEAATFDRWRLVFRANALTACCHVVSVNRPRPEGGVGLGGPSIVVAPDGEVLVESMETIVLADLDPHAVDRARQGYPGYLAVRSDIYRNAWSEAPARPGPAGRPR